MPAPRKNTFVKTWSPSQAPRRSGKDQRWDDLLQHRLEHFLSFTIKLLLPFSLGLALGYAWAYQTIGGASISG